MLLSMIVIRQIQDDEQVFQQALTAGTAGRNLLDKSVNDGQKMPKPI